LELKIGKVTIFTRIFVKLRKGSSGLVRSDTKFSLSYVILGSVWLSAFITTTLPYNFLFQIELYLKSAIDCLNQTNASQRYMPIPPHPRMDNMGGEFLSYCEYLSTSKQQVNFASDVKALLNQAADDVVNRRYAHN
jgi:hypothetical protein